MTDHNRHIRQDIMPREFVRRFQHTISRNDASFVWVIGAGCSVSSGIPDTNGLIRLWGEQLQYLETGQKENYKQWLRETFRSSLNDSPDKTYKLIFRRLFRTPQDQQRELDRLMNEAKIGFGYATLAQIIGSPIWGKYSGSVITTNFDDLLIDALYLYSNTRPQILSQNVVTRRTMLSYNNPRIFRITGSSHDDSYDNSRFTRSQVPPDIARLMGSEFMKSGVIFIGCSGNDEVLSDFLDSLPSDAAPYGVYWISDKPPEEAFSGWVGNTNPIWVQTNDFDLVMYYMRLELNLPEPDLLRAEQMLSFYKDQLRNLDIVTKSAPEIQDVDDKLTQEHTNIPCDNTEVYSAEYQKHHCPQQSATYYAHDTVATDAQQTNSEVPSHDITNHKETPPADTYTEPEDNCSVSDLLYIEEIEADIDSTMLTHTDSDLCVDDDEKSWISPKHKTADQYQVTKHEASEISCSENENGNLSPSSNNSSADISQCGKENPVRVSPSHVIDSLPCPTSLVSSSMYESGNSSYQTAINLWPEDPYLRLLYARFLLKGGMDYSSADTNYMKALQLSSNDNEILQEYIMFRMQYSQDFNTTEELIKQMFTNEVQSPLSLLIFSEFLLARKGDLEGARNSLSLAIEGNPTDERIGISYAQFLEYRSGKPQEAENQYNTILQQHPTSQKALAALCSFKMRNRHPHNDIEKIISTVEVDDIVDSDLYNCHASFMIQKKQFDIAEDLFIRGMKLPQSSPDLLNGYAIFLYSHKNDNTKAEQIFLTSLKKFPNSAYLLSECAAFMDIACNNLEKSEKYHRRALTAEPKNPFAIAAYANFVVRRYKHMDSARIMIREAMQLAPYCASLIRSFAAALRMTEGDTAQVHSYLEKARVIDGLDEDHSQLFLSYGHFLQKTLPQATDILEDSLAKHEARITPHDMKVLRQFLKSMELKPADPNKKITQINTHPVISEEKITEQNNNTDYKAILSLTRAAQFLLLEKRYTEGIKVLDDAFSAVSSFSKDVIPQVLLIEIWLYRYVYDSRYTQEALLVVISMLKNGVRCEGTSLVLRIADIRKLPHHATSDYDLITSIIRVAYYRADFSILSKWKSLQAVA